MQDSEIEWTDMTWNVTRGCSWASPECTHCYAQKFAGRFSGPGQPYEGLVRLTKRGWQWNGQMRFLHGKLAEPGKVKEPKRIFVDSMSDLFHDNVSDEEIELVFLAMIAFHWHTYQILTKRSTRLRFWFESAAAQRVEAEAIKRGLSWPLKHVHLGVSCGLQDYADRITDLLGVPAALHFVSAEPLLGPLDLRVIPCPADDCGPEYGCEFCGGKGVIDAFENGLDWVIVGGESGAGARPMDEDWVRELVAQCDAASVPIFYKQKKEGRRKVKLPVLDGRQYAELPACTVR